jgi:hypothetical protein
MAAGVFVAHVRLERGRAGGYGGAQGDVMFMRRRSIAREFGTAFAVLALYVLTLLLPLHQVAGAQRELNALGFETIGVWSVCASLTEDQDGDPQTATAVKCPAAGIAKHEFTAPPAGTPELVREDVATSVRYAVPVYIPDGQTPDHFGQSRAPPVTA